MDYFLEQLLPVCTEEYAMPEVMRVDTVLMAKKVSSPKFMQLRIGVADARVLIKATPSVKTYWKLELNRIDITSKPYRTAHRLLASPNPQKFKEVWAEKMTVLISNAQFIYRNDKARKEKNISNVFDYQLDIDRTLFRTEYPAIFANAISRGEGGECLPV